MQHKVILLIGPSGSGKSTIANELFHTYGLKPIDSYTTRPPRYSGEPGHIFVSDAEFDRLTGIVAYTEFDGHRYISKHKLDHCPQCGSEHLDYATRVIGYLKRVSKFSEARQKEAENRYYAKP